MSASTIPSGFQSAAPAGNPSAQPPALSKRPSLLSFLAHRPTIRTSIQTEIRQPTSPFDHQQGPDIDYTELPATDSAQAGAQRPAGVPTGDRTRTRTRTTSNGNGSAFAKHRPTQPTVVQVVGDGANREGEEWLKRGGMGETGNGRAEATDEGVQRKGTERFNENGKRHVRTIKPPPGNDLYSSPTGTDSPSMIIPTAIAASAPPPRRRSIVPVVQSTTPFPPSPELPFAKSGAEPITRASGAPHDEMVSTARMIRPIETLPVDVQFPARRARTRSAEALTGVGATGNAAAGGGTRGRPIGGVYDEVMVTLPDVGVPPVKEEEEEDGGTDEEEEEEEDFACTGEGGAGSTGYRSRGLDEFSPEFPSNPASTAATDELSGTACPHPTSRLSYTTIDPDGDLIVQRNRWSAVRYTPGPMLDLSLMDVDVTTGMMFVRPDAGVLREATEVKQRGKEGGKSKAERGSAKLKKKDSGVLKGPKRDDPGKGFVGRIKNAFPSSTAGSSQARGVLSDSTSSSLDGVSSNGVFLRSHDMFPLERSPSRRGRSAELLLGLGLDSGASLDRAGWGGERGVVLGIPVEMEIPRVLLIPAEEDENAQTPIVLHETYSPSIEKGPFFTLTPHIGEGRRRSTADLAGNGDLSRSRSPPTIVPHPMSAGTTSAWSNWTSSTTGLDGELEMDGRVSFGDEGLASPASLPLNPQEGTTESVSSGEGSQMTISPDLEDDLADDVPLGQVVLQRAKQKREGEVSPVSMIGSLADSGDGEIEAEVLQTPERSSRIGKQMPGENAHPFPHESLSDSDAGQHFMSAAGPIRGRVDTLPSPAPTPSRKDSTDLARNYPKSATPLGMGRPQLSQFDGQKCTFDMPPATFSSRAIQRGSDSRRSVIMPKRREDVLSDLADKRAERRRTKHQSGLRTNGPPPYIPPSRDIVSATPFVHPGLPEQDRPPRKSLDAEHPRPSIRLIVTKELPPIQPEVAIGPSIPSESSSAQAGDKALRDITSKVAATTETAEKRAHRTSLNGMLQSRRTTRPSAMLVSASPPSVQEVEFGQEDSVVEPEVAQWVKDSASASADEAKRARRLTPKRSLPSMSRKVSGGSTASVSTEEDIGTVSRSRKTLSKRFSLASLKDVFKSKSKFGPDGDGFMPPMPPLPRQYSAEKQDSTFPTPAFSLPSDLSSPPLPSVPAHEGFMSGGLGSASSDPPETQRSAGMPMRDSSSATFGMTPSDTVSTEATSNSLSYSGSRFTSSSSVSGTGTGGTYSDAELFSVTPIIGARRASNIHLTGMPLTLGEEEEDTRPSLTFGYTSMVGKSATATTNLSRFDSVEGSLGLTSPVTANCTEEEMENLRQNHWHRTSSSLSGPGKHAQSEEDMRKLDSMHFNEDGLGIDFGQWKSTNGTGAGRPDPIDASSKP